jgi:tRNA(Ile)-lysidine synthase
VEVVRVEVRGPGGPEAAARAARYAALDAAAAALDAHVLLGHTRDDQAETVLLGLGRGSGPRSIAGMRPADGRYLRPFLDLRRGTTVAACAALGLTPWYDPHNGDPAFQRVRLRQQALPLLEEILQGGVTDALARTAELLQDDLDALDEWARSVPVADELEVPPLAALPRAVRTRVLRGWLHPVPLTAERTAAVDALVTDWRGQGPVNLPGGASVLRVSGRLRVIPPTHRGEP